LYVNTMKGRKEIPNISPRLDLDITQNLPPSKIKKKSTQKNPSSPGANLKIKNIGLYIFVISNIFMRSVDIYNRTGKLEKALDKLKKNKKIIRANKETILEFDKVASTTGIQEGDDPLGVARRQKYVHLLINFSNMLKKDFRKTDKDDMIGVIQELEKRGLSEWTLFTYKTMIKKFYSWLRGCDIREYPPEVKWIRPKIKNGNHKLPEDLLTEKEIKTMLEACENPRDRALVSVLYESGCRISEIAGMRIKDVIPDEHGCIILVTGKTGDRRVRLVFSTRDLVSYIEIHPNREECESPLWIGIGTKNHSKLITHNAFNRILKSVAIKAGVKTYKKEITMKNGKKIIKIFTKVHPHLFRHSRASTLAKNLTDAQLKQIFGWTQGSKMAATYIHLSGRDVDDAILQLNGIIPKEKPTSKLKPIACSICNYKKNSPVATFCGQCARPLSEQAANDLERKIMETAKKVGNYESKMKPHDVSILQKALSPNATNQDYFNLAILLNDIRLER